MGCASSSFSPSNVTLKRPKPNKMESFSSGPVGNRHHERRPTISERMDAEITRKESGRFSCGSRQCRYLCAMFAGFEFVSRKANCQDTFLIQDRLQSSNNTYSFFAVCDGHGKDGDKISNFVVAELPKRLSQYLDEVHSAERRKTGAARAQLSRVMNNTFRAVDQALNSMPLNSANSGSTATILLMSQTHVHVGHIGDSKAVLASLHSTGRMVTRDITPMEHNFEQRKEVSRVQHQGGLVLKGRGPPRAFRSDGRSGLAISRCFGDSIAREIGIIAVPDVTSFPLQDGDEFIVVGTDGVWDVFASQEAAEFVRNNENGKVVDGKHVDVAECLVRECARRWFLKNEGLSDDITCVIVFLREPRQRQASYTPALPAVEEVRPNLKTRATF